MVYFIQPGKSKISQRMGTMEMVLLQTGVLNVSRLAESINEKKGRDSVSTYIVTK